MPPVQCWIDRIENGVAVLIGRDDETMRVTMPAAGLPAGSKEGDLLTIRLEKDDAETAAAKERVTSLVERLRKKG